MFISFELLHHFEMKYIIAILFIVRFFNLSAQQFSETVYILTDKSQYERYDTVSVQGLLLCVEDQQISRASNYCYVELISGKGDVLQRQKVRCSNGIFSTSFPLNSVSERGVLFIRAYTHFMKNFPEATYPMRLIEIGNDKSKLICLAKKEEKFPIQLLCRQNVLIYKYIPKDSRSYVLTICMDNGAMNDYLLHEQQSGCIPLQASPPYALTCFVTEAETDRIIFSQFINVADSLENKMSDLRLSADKYRPGDTLCLPVMALSEETVWLMHYEKIEDGKRNNPTLKSQLNMLPMTYGKEYKDLFRQQYNFNYTPEKIMTLKGRVDKEYGKLRKGTMTAFDYKRGLHYDCDIQPDGSFIMGVDDYPPETTFYLQAFNEKGKKGEYRIEMVNDTIPTVCIPHLKWEPKQSLQSDLQTTTLDTTRMHWISEVTVEAKNIKPAPSSLRFYRVNYLEAKDLETGAHKNLESVYRCLKGVQICTDDITGSPYLISTRGPSTFEGTGKIPIFVDGYRTNEEENIFELLNVTEIKSIEYISASRANIYGSGSLDGVILIKTKGANSSKKELFSYGYCYAPVGISPSLSEAKGGVEIFMLPEGKAGECKLQLPMQQGDYILVVEMICGNKYYAKSVFPFIIL